MSPSAFVDTSKLEGDIMAIAILLDWLNYRGDVAGGRVVATPCFRRNREGKVRIQQETPSVRQHLATTAIEGVCQRAEMVDATGALYLVKDVAAYKNDPKKARRLLEGTRRNTYYREPPHICRDGHPYGQKSFL